MSESEHDDTARPARPPPKLCAAPTRPDERGGELRDYLQDKVAHDPRYARARQRVERWLGRQPAPVAPTRAAAPGPAAPPVAAAPAAAAAAPRPRGFGDPGIKAQVYGKRSCPWTGRAITLLERHKVDFDFVDVEEPEHESKLVVLSQETHQHTVPYVYLRGRFIGGFNALSEIERLGQLEVALMSKEELAAAPPHLRAVEIVPRPNTDEVAPAEADPPGNALG